jgi:predicted TIM-barrel fold metal-dependent hydrolase
MKFFDANACFGGEMVNHEIVNHERFVVIEPVKTADNAAELVASMDRMGIEKAIVRHSTQLEFDPSEGNSILMRERAGYEERLIPSWVILPEISDPEFSINSFFDKMKAAGVKALRAYPEVNRFFLNGEVMKEQLDLICELKIPLYLESRYGFEHIYAVLKEFPELTVVVANTGIFPSARFMFPLLNRYRSVYFETGDFTMQRGYEEVCAKFGASRMLFGTNFPSNSMGCSMSALLGAGISGNEKEAIAGANLEWLLGEVRL